MRSTLALVALVGAAQLPASLALDAFQGSAEAAYPTPTPAVDAIQAGFGVGQLRRAHRRHGSAAREARGLWLGQDLISQLIGGEFTTMNINQPGSGNDRGSGNDGGSGGGSSTSHSRPLTGGEFTTKNINDPGSSSHSSTRSSSSSSSADDSAPNTSSATLTSVKPAGGVAASSASAATSSSPSSSPSTSSPSSTSSMTRSRATTTAAPVAASSRASSSSPPTSMSTLSSLAPVSVTTQTSVTTDSSTATADPASNIASQHDKSSSSDHTGLIAGLTVGLGVPLLILLGAGALWMSKRRKREDDIVWPDLNHDSGVATSAPLPARNTGGAGFEMGHDSTGAESPSLPSGQTDPFASNSMGPVSTDGRASYAQHPYDPFAEQAQAQYDAYAQEQYDLYANANAPPPLHASNEPVSYETPDVVRDGLPAPHALSEGAEYGQYGQYVVGGTYPHTAPAADAPPTRTLTEASPFDAPDVSTHARH